MPLNFILEVKIFDVWGINFMRHFSSSRGNKYLFIDVDYVSKWVDTIVSHTNESWIVTKVFKRIIFPHFEVIRVLIGHNGMHFIEKKLEALLKTYRVHHKYGLSYHPEISGQIEISNREIKSILEKTVTRLRKD